MANRRGKVEAVTDFFLGLQNHCGGDCSHEIRSFLPLHQLEPTPPPSSFHLCWSSCATNWPSFFHPQGLCTSFSFALEFFPGLPTSSSLFPKLRPYPLGFISLLRTTNPMLHSPNTPNHVFTRNALWSSIYKFLYLFKNKQNSLNPKFHWSNIWAGIIELDPTMWECKLKNSKKKR